MNPTLAKKHRELEALQSRSDELLAKDEHTAEESAEIVGSDTVVPLAKRIEDKEAEIKALVALAEKTGTSREFLNGAAQRSVSSSLANREQNDDPDIPARAIARARLKHFEDPKQAYRFGMFAMAALLRRPGAIKFCERNGIPLLAAGQHNESINEDGGFLVPEEFDTTMIRIIEKYGVFRQEARYVPMGSDTHTRPRRTGGVTAYWVDEGEEADESNAQWDRVRLTARKLMVNTRVTSEVNEDALANFGEMLMFEIAYAFAKKEDQAGFAGTGTSTYGRIVGLQQRLLDVYTTSGGVGLVLGAGNLYSELTLPNFNSVKAALPDLADSLNAKWYVHRAFFYGVMEKLAMAAGGVTMAEIAAGGPAKFLGYPVVFTNAMPKTEANGQVCAVFGDLSMAADFGDRRGTSIAMSEHAFFQSDQIAVRGTERVDINVHDVGDSTTAGPVVGLVTASS